MVGALGETSDSHQTRSRHSEVPLGSLDWVRWKCEAAINKPIHKQIHPAFTQWEPLSLRPPSNSIYAFSHSLTSQQPEINSGLSNPNLSPFPLIGVGQAPGLCKKGNAAQGHWTSPHLLREHSPEPWGLTLPHDKEHTHQLQCPLTKTSSKHTVKKLLKWKHKQRFGW